MDAEEAYRARVALWLELPEGLIVGQEVTGTGSRSDADRESVSDDGPDLCSERPRRRRGCGRAAVVVPPAAACARPAARRGDVGLKPPREALRTPAGRAAVDVLLKEMENMEERAPAAERFNFAALRAKLGLDD